MKHWNDCTKVIRLLAERRCGYTCKEILEHTGIKDGGGASDILKGLVESEFIKSHYPFGARKTEHYRLADHFCAAYLQFLDGKDKPDLRFWQKNNASPRLNSWRGFAFEELCFAHIEQVKQKLGIGSVTTTESSWIIETNNLKQQIDMLIDRADNVVNLCEIKFYAKPFVINGKYEAELRERIQTLMDNVPQKKSIHLTLIAAYGLRQNECSGMVQSVVTLDDLFAW